MGEYEITSCHKHFHFPILNSAIRIPQSEIPSVPGHDFDRGAFTRTVLSHQ